MFARSRLAGTFLRDSSLDRPGPDACRRSSAARSRGQPTRSDGRVLVVIQLDGGNDGINTVVPFADEGYAKHRKELRIADEQADQARTTRSACTRPEADGRAAGDGRLAIVQGVGYPNPNRSHFVSMAIWHTARFDPDEHKSFGWIGRRSDAASRRRPTGAPHSILIADRTPPVAPPRPPLDQCRVQQLQRPADAAGCDTGRIAGKPGAGAA